MAARRASRTGRQSHRLGCRLLWVVVPLAVLLAGCGASTHSTVEPDGPKSRVVTMSWWILFGVAGFVCLVVISLALRAAISRRGPKAVVKPQRGERFVVVFGIVIPAVILAGTFALSVGTLSANSGPSSTPRLTIDVIGHRWWWEFRYPASGAVTANELHVPVGQPVELRLWTADVIHSFWAPALMPKIDLLPRRVNQTWLSVDKAGTYRGQCAEYCGTQHAHMAFSVVAQPSGQFRSWLSREARPAAAPTGALAKFGRHVLETSTCSTCHTVRGTSAHGHIGPDLTHVGSRQKLAGETILNNVGNMSGWIADSQTIKPGNLMPPQAQLSPRELHAVVTYLQGLK